jgi:hypothetical protein
MAGQAYDYNARGVSQAARQKRAPRTPSLQGFRGSCLFAVICGREQAREDAQGPRVEQLLTISPDLGYDLHEVFDDSGVLAATLSSPIALRLLLQGAIDGVRAAGECKLPERLIARHPRGALFPNDDLPAQVPPFDDLCT